MPNVRHQSMTAMGPLSAPEVVVETTSMTDKVDSHTSMKDAKIITMRSVISNSCPHPTAAPIHRNNELMPTALRPSELRLQGAQIRPLKSHGHQIHTQADWKTHNPSVAANISYPPVPQATVTYPQAVAAAAAAAIAATTITTAQTRPQDIMDGKPWRPINTMKRRLMNSSPFSRNVLETSQTGSEDTDMGEGPVKKMKLNMVRPKFDVKYAEHLVHIGNARYVVYGEVDDEPIFRLQECDYKQSVGGEKPQPKMIRLSLQQWIDLTTLAPVIDDAIEEFDEVKHHLGRNTYIRVQQQRRRVDIRDYFLPNCPTSLDILPTQFESLLVPTRRGLSLTYDEWYELVNKAMPLIKFGADKLQKAVVESCVGQHNAQKEWLMCHHCNPNGYTVWM